MRYYKFLFCLLLFPMLFSCKGNSGESNTVEVKRELKSTREIPIGDYEDVNKQARSILDYRYQQFGKESYAAIEMDRWYYEFKAIGPEIDRVVDGSWIDFYPDLTYEYGDQDGKLGSGKYHYAPETGLVLLVDDNERIKPREYEAKIVGPTMVFIGKETYQDNFFQCKLAMDHVDRKDDTAEEG